MSGTVLGVPIANAHGFRRSSRYLPDRRDLNRFFPGRAQGSSASRIAHALFEQVVRRCKLLVDFHTGSFHRTNFPHLRADLNNAAVREIATMLPPENIFAEPAKRDTAPAVALGIGLIAARDPDAVMIVLPADHLIRDEDEFRAVLADAVAASTSTEARWST